MFKTIEEANEYKVKQEKLFNDLKLAHEGLEKKLQATETSVSEKEKEIEGLKIKNYELLTQLSEETQGNNHSHSTDNESQNINFEDFLKEF